MVRQGIVQADQSKPGRGFWRVAHMTIGRRAVDPSLGGLAQYLEGHRPEIFVYQLILEEFSVQRWSTFTEQRPDTMFLPEPLRDGGKIDPRSFSHGDNVNRAVPA